MRKIATFAGSFRNSFAFCQLPLQSRAADIKGTWGRGPRFGSGWPVAGARLQAPPSPSNLGPFLTAALIRVGCSSLPPPCCPGGKGQKPCVFPIKGFPACACRSLGRRSTAPGLGRNSPAFSTVMGNKSPTNILAKISSKLSFPTALGVGPTVLLVAPHSSCPWAVLESPGRARSFGWAGATVVLHMACDFRGLHRRQGSPKTPSSLACHGRGAD